MATGVVAGNGRGTQLNVDVCPWCGQSIPHDRLDEITARIAAREHAQFAELESGLKAGFAHEKAALSAEAEKRYQDLKEQGSAAVEAANQQATVAIAAARHEAANAAAAQLATSEQEKRAALERVEQLKSEQEQVLGQRIQEVRAAMEADKVGAVNAEKAKHFEEKLKLQEKLQLLQRQVEQKPAGELGEGAEIDLFEMLKAAFPNDQINRVPKGSPGADIIQEIYEGRELCGRIVYDSKNRGSWLNSLATKLRKDQIAAQADYAVLTTQAFPQGARQLTSRDGVVIANPARVRAVAELLRRAIVQAHSLRLSGVQRDEKITAIYDFVTSDRCRQMFDHGEELTQSLLDLEVKEVKAHEATWKQRGELIRSTQRNYGDVEAEIDRIVGGPRTGSLAVV